MIYPMIRRLALFMDSPHSFAPVIHREHSPQPQRP
jgi:hypothetical protein